MPIPVNDVATRKAILESYPILERIASSLERSELLIGQVIKTLEKIVEELAPTPEPPPDNPVTGIGATFKPKET